VDSRYAGTTPVVVPLAGSGTVAIEAVGQNGLRYREERAVVAGADEVLVIDLEAEAARQRARQQAAQEEQAGHDFILFVLLAMIFSVIAAVLSALFGGSRSK
jgi:23S rRNA G2445 N2-methylase RlmL